MENQSPALIGNLLINNSDAEGDPLSILNITNTVNGAIYVNLNNGFINYYTLPEFCGVDTIRYAVSDGNFIIYDTLFLTINCVNNAPSQGNETLTVQENSGTTNTVDLLANNIDPEGDVLTITSMQTPLNGTLTANGDGTYAYTPNADYCGTEVLAYVVSDGVNNVTDYLTINVVCQNDPPTGGNEYMTIDEDGPTTNSGSLLANNSDPEGNTLTILSMTSSGGGVYLLTSSASVNYTPNPDWCGIDTLTYTVTDGVNIITDTLFVTVICINDLPTNGNEWIITDTDVTRRVVAKNLLASKTCVADVMTPNPSCVSMLYPGTDALMTMVENRFRHLPVTDASGAVVGVLDIAKCLNDAISKLEQSKEKCSMQWRTP